MTSVRIVNGINVSVLTGNTGAAFMTLNGTDWATGTASPSAATYVNNVFTASSDNINVTTSGNWSGTSLNTLRFNTGSPTLTVTGANTLAAGGLLIGSGAAAVTLSGAGTIAGTAFGSANGEINVFNYGSSVATLSAAFVNNVDASSYLAAAPYGDALSIFGTGITLLNSTKNVYTGGTNVSGSATLKLGQNNAIPGILQPGNVSISGGATLDLNGKIQILYGLNGAGIVDNTTASAVNFTVGYNNATTANMPACYLRRR
jgi:hypothetical protein